jgi:hypothetical protein
MSKLALNLFFDKKSTESDFPTIVFCLFRNPVFQVAVLILTRFRLCSILHFESAVNIVRFLHFKRAVNVHFASARLQLDKHLKRDVKWDRCLL